MAPFSKATKIAEVFPYAFWHILQWQIEIHLGLLADRNFIFLQRHPPVIGSSLFTTRVSGIRISSFTPSRHWADHPLLRHEMRICRAHALPQLQKRFR